MEPAAAVLRASSRQSLPVDRVLTLLTELFGSDLHAKRILSLAHATVGVIAAGSLGVSAIGQGMAAARSVKRKHATKQVDRLLSNRGIDVTTLTRAWTTFVLREFEEAWINLDWTDFDADGHTTLVASVQERRGRATPLMWLTVSKAELDGRKWSHVETLLTRLRAAIPRTTPVYIVGDREFGCRTMYAMLDGLGFGYVLRFRQDVHVRSWSGEQRKAADWHRGTGKLRSMMSASVTVEDHRVGKVVVAKDKGMKDLWCLACSDPDLPPAKAKKRYGFRFECEETFRDLKDPRFGMGLRHCRIAAPERRDRILLLGVLAQAMLTLLGIAGERCGMDRHLKTNTSKTRQHSLLRQGLMWYDLIPNMPEDELLTLMNAFHEVAHEHEVFRLAFGLEE